MSDWIAPLRASLKARIIAAGTIAGARVVSEQADPTYTDVDGIDAKLPRVCIYTPDDDLKTVANGTRWDSTTTIVFDCWAYGIASVVPPVRIAEEAAGDMRDRLAFQVCRATIGNAEWAQQFSGGLTANMSRKIEKKGQVTYGCTRIILTVPQPVDFTLAGEPATEDLLERVVLQFDNTLGGGPEGRTELTADIAVPQTGGDS